MEKSLILVSFLTCLSVGLGFLESQVPETGGKCCCKADVLLVKEEVIREYLSTQDPELEEADKYCRILE